MDKQEYLSNEYLKYLDNMDKEGMMDAITPLIKRLPSYALEKLLKLITLTLSLITWPTRKNC